MDFRTALVGLAPYITHTGDLISAADWVVANSTPHPAMENTHDNLVRRARDSHKVWEQVQERKKIEAIKQLRALTGCGLKEAKEAIEDDRVWGLLW